MNSAVPGLHCAQGGRDGSPLRPVEWHLPNRMIINIPSHLNQMSSRVIPSLFLHLQRAKCYNKEELFAFYDLLCTDAPNQECASFTNVFFLSKQLIATCYKYQYYTVLSGQASYPCCIIFVPIAKQDGMHWRCACSQKIQV